MANKKIFGKTTDEELLNKKPAEVYAAHHSGPEPPEGGCLCTDCKAHRETLEG